MKSRARLTRLSAVATLTVAAGCTSEGAAARVAQGTPHALVVRHATVLDTRTARTLVDRAIVMNGEWIVRVVPDSALDTLPGAQVIDARGRLVIPGLIDVHHHSAYVFPDSITSGGGAVSKLVMRPDSIASYRTRWAAAYLPFGVTAVREVGGDERYLPLMTAWMQSTPSAPDFIPSGGAL